MAAQSNICTTGIPGFDEILRGGLPRHQMYLLQGNPGTGKTTLAMQFLLEGARLGEKGLYITFSETRNELELVAESHGWDLSKISLFELTAFSGHSDLSGQTTIFHPAEVEMERVYKILIDVIGKTKPDRVVLDSVSELRLLGESSHRYRRMMLTLKEFFLKQGTTVLFLDDMTVDSTGDLTVRSIVHGVFLLEKIRAAYGVERCQCHIVKLRGVSYSGGTHDYLIKTGGLQLFPRLISEHRALGYKEEIIPSGVKGFDEILCGGLDRGTSNLIMGPAGSGKSTISLTFAINAARAGKKVHLFSFEESTENLTKRARLLGVGIDLPIVQNNLKITKVDPAQLTPGQFGSVCRNAVDFEDLDVAVIDSLNGYIQAMPEQQFLMLQLHELLGYLGSRGVVTLMILAQSGLIGHMQTPLDLTYLADTVIITRYFESAGAVKKALSVVKKRTGKHEETIRQLTIGPGGFSLGKVLEEFEGVLTGVPRYYGARENIRKG